jgi:hypothetical protein
VKSSAIDIDQAAPEPEIGRKSATAAAIESVSHDID